MARLIRRLWILLGSILVASSLALLIYWYQVETFAFAPGPNEAEIEFVIDMGTPPRQIADSLEKKGAISSAHKFYVYLRYMARKAGALRAGDYIIKPHMRPVEIIELLQKGLKKEFRFTIPEGSNKKEIAEIVAKTGLVSREDFWLAMQNPELIKEFGIPSTGAGGQKGGVSGGIEGYLFPDTYQFPKGTLSETILRRMHERLLEKMTLEMYARLDEMGWSLHKLLTMASLVEKETAHPEERPLVASVFFNRMKKGMKLQTDPTVIYSITNFDGRIAKRHLTLRHPYNTYMNNGLPPGPIDSPGMASIKAVLWPAPKNKYLYFVSRNNGTHIFCETYQCHLGAVKEFQIDYFRKKKAN